MALLTINGVDVKNNDRLKFHLRNQYMSGSSGDIWVVLTTHMLDENGNIWIMDVYESATKPQGETMNDLGTSPEIQGTVLFEEGVTDAIDITFNFTHPEHGNVPANFKATFTSLTEIEGDITHYEGEADYTTYIGGNPIDSKTGMKVFVRSYNVKEMDVPIATAEELQSLSQDIAPNSIHGMVRVFGEGTEWEGEYLTRGGIKHRQCNDIDLSGIEWSPVRLLNAPAWEGRFTEYDGGGFAVRNLEVDDTSLQFGVGLFQRFSNMRLHDLKLEDFSFNIWRTSGALAGTTMGDCLIWNVEVDGLTITANGTTNVREFGGLVGSDNAWPGKIHDCHMKRLRFYDVASMVGGVIGQGQSTLENCIVEDFEAVGHETVNNTGWGGFMGQLGSGQNVAIKECSAELAFTINKGNGGIAGAFGYGYSGSFPIERCAVAATIGGADPGNDVGGFFGGLYTDHTFSDCSVVGSISGDEKVGGFVGHCDAENGMFTRCYVSADVAGSDKVQAFAGWPFGADAKPETFTNCFYNSTVSGVSDAYVPGLTEEQMKDPANFPGWDFEAEWRIGPGINNGFPQLRWLPLPPVYPTDVALLKDKDGLPIPQFFSSEARGFVSLPEPASKSDVQVLQDKVDTMVSLLEQMVAEE